MAAMTTNEKTREWAAAAVRETLRRCVLILCAQLQRQGRANLGIDSMRTEGAGQLEAAKAIRSRSKKAGLL